MEKFYKLDALDSLEIISYANSQHEFPNHFHDTFVVSIIESGTIKENEYIGSQGNIVISNPKEIHNNMLYSENIYSFTSFYLSPDLIKSLSGGKCLWFPQKILFNPVLFQDLHALSSNIEENIKNDICKNLMESLRQLALLYGEGSDMEESVISPHITEAKLYIDRNFREKITLTVLMDVAKLDKFQLIRNFKKDIGLTPFEYIILQRIVESKLYLKQGAPIIDTALEMGFYDQSHFNKYFKRFVGMSPLHYLGSCNILQASPL